MNVKTAKYIRNLIDYNPNEQTLYTKVQAENSMGQKIEDRFTYQCNGKRRDYKLLKKYFKTGEIEILPAYLRSLV